MRKSGQLQVCLLLLLLILLKRITAYNFCGAGNEQRMCGTCKRHVVCNPEHIDSNAKFLDQIDMTYKVQRDMLAKVNGFRNRAAGGLSDIGGQKQMKPAARMRMLQWDWELAFFATHKSRSCSLQKSQCQATPHNRQAGEFTGYFGQDQTPISLEAAFEQIFAVIGNQSKGIADKSLLSNDYSQEMDEKAPDFCLLINDRATRVGCAMALCTDCKPAQGPATKFCYFLTCVLDVVNAKGCAVYQATDSVGGADCRRKYHVERSKNYEFLCENDGREMMKCFGSKKESDCDGSSDKAGGSKSQTNATATTTTTTDKATTTATTTSKTTNAATDATTTTTTTTPATTPAAGDQCGSKPAGATPEYVYNDYDPGGPGTFMIKTVPKEKNASKPWQKPPPTGAFKEWPLPIMIKRDKATRPPDIYNVSFDTFGGFCSQYKDLSNPDTLRKLYKLCTTAQKKKDLKHLACNFPHFPPYGKLIGLFKPCKHERYAALHWHNYVRNNVAGGNEYDTSTGKKYPAAARMRALVWDEELEWLALWQTKQCVFAHDKCRSTPNYRFPGQNLGILPKNFDASKKIKTLNLQYVESVVFKGFYNEKNADMDLNEYIKHYNLDYHGGEKSAGHYAQLVFDSISRVGCAYSLCESYDASADPKMKVKADYAYLYACHYDLGMMNNMRLYEMGEPGSKCESAWGLGRDKKYPNLCAKSKKLTNEFINLNEEDMNVVQILNDYYKDSVEDRIKN